MLRLLFSARSIPYLGVMFWLTVSGITRANDKVEWRTNYDSARKEASEKGKPIFLDFGTEDCFHCRRLHQSTFRDPAVIRLLNERFIPLKIDANREPRLTQTLRIQAFPTLIIAGNDGKIHGWIEGYMDASRLQEHLVRATAQQTPDWMARDFQDAGKAIAAGDYPQAITLLKKIGSDGKERPVQLKAKELLFDLEQQAANRFQRARQLHEKGQTSESVEQINELVKKYAGTTAAVTAADFLASVADKPDLRGQQRARRAEELLQLAKDDLKKERFLSCLENCELLILAYREYPAAKEATQIISEVKSNPERMAKVCESMQNRLAEMYISLAESWMEKGQPQLAVACLEKVMNIGPNTSAAQSAQAKLAALTKPVITPMGFQKPR